MDDIYNTDLLLKRRAMETVLGTPVQSPITQPPPLTQPPMSQPQDVKASGLQGSYENTVQTQANLLANQPHYHGWKKFFDVLAQMSPIGRGIETAAGIGTLGYQRRLGQVEQNVDRLGQQLNHDPTRQYQAPQSAREALDAPPDGSQFPWENAASKFSPFAWREDRCRRQ